MKKLTFRYNLQDCPSLEELAKFRQGRLPRMLDRDIADHLTFCKVCSGKVTVLDPEASEDIPEVVEMPEGFMEKVNQIARQGRREGTTLERVQAIVREAPGPVTSFQPGYISLTKMDVVVFIFPKKVRITEETRLVVVLDPLKGEAQEAPVVALASFSVEYAGEYDVVIPAEKSPFGIPFMVECWNHVSVLRSLIEPHGYVLVEELPELLAANNAYTKWVYAGGGYEYPVPGATEKFARFRHLERKVLARLAQSAQYWILSPIEEFPSSPFHVPLTGLTKELSLGDQHFRVQFLETDLGTRISTVRKQGPGRDVYFWILNRKRENVFGWGTDHKGISDVYISETILPPGDYELLMEWKIAKSGPERIPTEERVRQKAGIKEEE